MAGTAQNLNPSSRTIRSNPVEFDPNVVAGNDDIIRARLDHDFGRRGEIFTERRRPTIAKLDRNRHKRDE